jgi:hypothetical protein
MNAIQPVHMSQEQKVLDVFNRHFAAFTSANLDDIVNDFTEQSVVITPDGVFEGLDRIRALYQGLLAEFGVIDRGDSPGITIDVLHVRHDMLFITWHAESKYHIFSFATDTFVFNGDKVERQSISFPPLQPR